MTRQRWIGLAAGLALALACLTWGGCSRPAQIGGDELTFKEVDALYTAVTSRRTELLNASRQRLEALQAQGRLPQSAHAQLSQIIELADRQQWQTAAERLWTFMRGQRRA